MTNDFAEMVPDSGSVPAGCGVWLFSSWMVPVCSQITCATNCATPGYKMIITVVKHVVKAVFRPMALRKWFPLLIVSQRVAGLGFSLMDRDRTLPNHVRYQLRYTRIFSFSA